MNYDRAKEILHSDDTIEVLYNNKPVWIHDVDSANKIAKVTDSEQNKLDVSIEELKEGGK